MGRYKVTVAGDSYEVTLIRNEASRVSFSVDGKVYDVEIDPVIEAPKIISQVGFIAPSVTTPKASTSRNGAKAGDIVAPMPGIIVTMPLKENQEVTPGDTVAVIEAMKMENNIPTTVAGKIKKVHVKPGQEVDGGQVLVSIG